jgi:hypothetical protein
MLAFLRQYSREYSGFSIDGVRYVICQMNLFYIHFDKPPDNCFSFIGDGGSSVVRVVYKAESKEIAWIECNGEA